MIDGWWHSQPSHPPFHLLTHTHTQTPFHHVPWVTANTDCLHVNYSVAPSHLEETAGSDLRSTVVHVSEQHACHLLKGNASKVTYNSLSFCACAPQTSKTAGYGRMETNRKSEHQIRKRQINANSQTERCIIKMTTWCQTVRLFSPALC